MSVTSKLTLENHIFARAARLNTPVHARSGRLICTSADAPLGALITLYNAFFASENFAQFCQAENPLEGYQHFPKTSVRTTVLARRMYPFELLF